MATISRYTTGGGEFWEVRYRTPQRKTTRKRGFKTQREAKAFANTVEVRKSTGDYVAPALGRATIGELAVDWLARKEQSLAASTFYYYRNSWCKHVEPRWGSTSAAAVDVLQIEAWITGMARDGRGVGTIKHALSILSSILDDAVKGKRLSSNPAQSVRNRPRAAARRHVYLSSDDVRRLADAAGAYRALVLTLAYTGLRWGEAAALKVRDIKFLKRRLTVSENAVMVGGRHVLGTPKNGKGRTVPVPQFVLDALAAQCDGKAPDDLVFPASNGGYMRRQNPGEWFARAVEQAGVERVTPHGLRHTCASLAVSAGANVLALSRMLGHGQPSMTLNIYADLFDSDLDAVAAVMDEKYAGEGVRQIVSKTRPRRVHKSG